jgi:hypothetical protein
VKCKLCETKEAYKGTELCYPCSELRNAIAADPGLAAKILRSLSPPVADKAKSEGWHGVDLDGTLAHYDGWKGIDHVGEPIPRMAERVCQWLLRDEQVRIFTARVCPNQDGRVLEVVRYWIDKWCLEHFGRTLPVTNEKDFGMIDLWDDRCVQVIPNTGIRADGKE